MLNQFHLAWFLQRLFVIQVSINRFKLFFGATWQKIETMGLMLNSALLVNNHYQNYSVITSKHIDITQSLKRQLRKFWQTF